LKVFISWSGQTSQRVALVLHDWLPSVIQSIEPYVSSEDIDKGSRWGAEVAKELAESDYGILCVTPTNTQAPWVHFEAGALSKSLDKSRVAPFLFGLERSEIPQGPLVQFQSVLNERSEIWKLVSGLNASCDDRGLDERRLASVFDVWWPKLEAELNSVERDEPPADGGPVRSDQDVLAEILELARNQQKLLSDPIGLLPAGYLRSVLSDIGVRDDGHGSIHPAAFRDLDTRWRTLGRLLADEDVAVANEVRGAIEDLAGPISHIVRNARLARWEDGERTSPHRP
jgi:TIR domain